MVSDAECMSVDESVDASGPGHKMMLPVLESLPIGILIPTRKVSSKQIYVVVVGHSHTQSWEHQVILPRNQIHFKDSSHTFQKFQCNIIQKSVKADEEEQWHVE